MRPILDLTSAVRFWGERRDVGVVAAADVFVLSSDSEGLPISVLRGDGGRSSGDRDGGGGLPELVAMSGAGAIVPARRGVCLARAIVSFARPRHNSLRWENSVGLLSRPFHTRSDGREYSR